MILRVTTSCTQRRSQEFTTGEQPGDLEDGSTQQGPAVNLGGGQSRQKPETYVHVNSTETGETSSATAEIARVGGHYAVQGHSRSLILVPIETPYETSY